MKQFFFVLALLIADQISKFLVIKNFYLGESLNILPILDIFLILNTGIAFSLFDDGGSTGRWVLVILVLCVCLYLVYILLSESLDKFESIASLASGLFEAAEFHASTAIFLNLALSLTGQSIIVKSPAALSLAT